MRTLSFDRLRGRTYAGKRRIGAALVLLMTVGLLAAEPFPNSNVVLIIHGGVGAKPRETMTPEIRPRYEAALTAALKAGQAALKKEHGTSLDAVEAAIRVLEDSPLFNAGVGAVFTREGRNELDASIMEGKGLKAGAVTGVGRVKNPITLARAVMEKSEHVMLVGEGAERFARSIGMPEISPVELWTQERWNELNRSLKKETRNEHSSLPANDGDAQLAVKNQDASSPQPSRSREEKETKVSWHAISELGDVDPPHFGTVGAVALDREGNLAAGTSTGGMTGKRPGRVGDSPIIGAGTYAENGVCGVSCSGHGEVFIRHAVAHDVIARLKYGKAATVQEAARQTLDALPQEKGGVGGLIALDAHGNATAQFAAEAMFRGAVTADGKVVVKIYVDE
jgi:beta-aspartyl-peptidase (threonine type)